MSGQGTLSKGNILDCGEQNPDATSFRIGIDETDGEEYLVTTKLGQHDGDEKIIDLPGFDERSDPRCNRLN